MRRLLLSLGLFPLLALGAQPGGNAQRVEVGKADVVVYGGTAGGVIAAVAAAREGKTVILLEPGKHVGGMVSGGLGATDTGNRAAIGGYSREFFDRVRTYYVKKYGPQSPQVKDCSDGFRFEPHVAEIIFQEMLKEAKVDVRFGFRVVGRVGSTRDNRIHAVDNAQRESVVGQVFIDASYEGDLLALAGVSYTYGREGRAEFNESIAGVQKFSPAHQWSVKVPGLDDQGKRLPLIQAQPPGNPGDGDKRLQAYNFRLCMSDRPGEFVPWPKPANYDAQRYELLARYLAKKPDVKLGQLCNPVRVPNGKTDTNNNGPISTDHIGANWDYVEGDQKMRERIWQDHVEYTQGFFYFLANDPRVPAKLQKEVNQWGLAKGEFKDTNHWPHQLYVREARRMKGVYFMTQADIMENRTKPDSVGLGSYNTDSHHVQRVVSADGSVLNEGDFQVGVKPYAIPYRSLIPKKQECPNLLVPVCMSASHVAYGTIRMEPVYMILGQASGVAASLAIDGQTSVQDVSIEKLQTKLKAQKAVLSPEGLTKAAKGTTLDPAKLGGVVVDDVQATPTGAWVRSTATPGFVGEGYLHDNNEDQGKNCVRFAPKLPEAGKYEVRLFYPAHTNRASNVLVVIHGADGEKQVRVNQKIAAKEGHSLGVFAFAADGGWVEVRNDGANGFVIADAVQWLKKE